MHTGLVWLIHKYHLYFIWKGKSLIVFGFLPIELSHIKDSSWTSLSLFSIQYSLNFIHSSFHSFYKHLLNMCFVPSTVLVHWVFSWNQTWSIYSSEGRYKKMYRFVNYVELQKRWKLWNRTFLKSRVRGSVGDGMGPGCNFKYMCQGRPYCVGDIWENTWQLRKLAIGLVCSNQKNLSFKGQRQESIWSIWPVAWRAVNLEERNRDKEVTKTQIMYGLSCHCVRWVFTLNEKRSQWKLVNGGIWYDWLYFKKILLAAMLRLKNRRQEYTQRGQVGETHPRNLGERWWWFGSA